MMATLFEVYTQERFIELEKEKTIDIEELYKFIPEKWRHEYSEEVSEKSLTHVEMFIWEKNQLSKLEWVQESIY